jgi:hypothetical protein
MVGALASADVMGLFLSTPPPPPPPHPTKVNARKRPTNGERESDLSLNKADIFRLILDEANLDSCLDRPSVKVFVEKANIFNSFLNFG